VPKDKRREFAKLQLWQLSVLFPVKVLVEPVRILDGEEQAFK
jgi:hypothetical protein